MAPSGRRAESTSLTDIGNTVDKKLLFARIRSSLRQKLTSSIRNSHRSNFTFGNEELKSLFSLSNRYILPAPVAGLVCLISIRGLRRSLQSVFSSSTHRIQQRLTSSQCSNKFPQSPFRQTRTEEKPVGETSTHASSGGWYNAFTWIIDSLISFEATKLVFFHYPTERIEALAQIPLVPGTSVVSREFCPVLFDQFQGYPPGTIFDDVKLQALFTMHENCRLRKNYQRQLEYEFDGEATVPAPGVPTVGPHTAVDFDERFHDFVQAQQALKVENQRADEEN